MEIKGIDVSRYQGEIDWQTVAAQGVRFAMIKALQGSKAVDVRFAANTSGAAAAGIPFGVYVYSKALSAEEAGKEASAVLELTAGLDLSYPIALDVENADYRLLPQETKAAVINTFCSAVKAAGRLPLVYSSKDWLENVIPKECSERWDIWLAQWRKTAPDYKGSYTMWQYGKASIDGISTKADMDVCFVDYPALTAKNKPLVFAVTTPRIRGEAVTLMQRALNAANYRDSSGDPLDPDGIWGKKSQSALDRLVEAQTELR